MCGVLMNDASSCETIVGTLSAFTASSIVAVVVYFVVAAFIDILALVVETLACVVLGWCELLYMRAVWYRRIHGRRI